MEMVLKIILKIMVLKIDDFFSMFLFRGRVKIEN
jgi:hypothetical protein